MTQLAAFAWTPLEDPYKIAILGGTNGSIMQDELMMVDFKSYSCENMNASFPFYTCMGHLVYRHEEKTLYCFGGLNSSGINYELKNGTKEWEQCEKRHSVITNSHSMELVENPCIYFSHIEVGMF